MPGKNLIKQYVENGIYHTYNRGINKQEIFLDDQDYSVFLFFLKLYLDNPNNIKDLDSQKRKYLSRKNFYGKVDLLCYCLMPNHLHLVIKQKDKHDISDFMRCIMTNYSMYFNDKYERVGPLFQGRYKAVLIKEDNYLLHLSRYIHINPIAKHPSLGKLEEYNYSSYLCYLGKKNQEWVKPKFILDYFNNPKNKNIISKSSYQSFVEDYELDSKEILGNLTIE